jgi:multiple sugar transport system ATP-binding protein
MVAIALDAVTKVFPGGVVAVDQLSLDVTPGEFLVLLGPTGCGKSTVLRMIAGLDRPTSGHVLIDGEIVDDIPAQDRGVGMVFQHYALHPHMTVGQNIAQPLRIAHASQSEVEDRVAGIAELMGITDLLHRSPAMLSGGQRQRTAMARAILRDPRVFLLDEPLSNLDAGVRAELRAEIGRLARQLGATTIYVTHDQVEAMTMADRVAVLRRGVLQQVGTPHDVYEDPQTLFVAAFLGTPRINLLQAAVYPRPDRSVLVDLGAQALTVAAADPLAVALAGHHNERVTIGLRPDSLQPAGGPAGGPVLRGIVRLVEHLGHEILVHLDTESVPAVPASVGLDYPDRHLADTNAAELPTTGALHALRHPIDRFMPRGRGRPEHASTARTEYGFYPTYEASEGAAPAGDLVVRLAATTRPVAGDTMSIAVDLDRLLLFDRAGRRIPLG